MTYDSRSFEAKNSRFSAQKMTCYRNFVCVADFFSPNLLPRNQTSETWMYLPETVKIPDLLVQLLGAEQRRVLLKIRSITYLGYILHTSSYFITDRIQNQYCQKTKYIYILFTSDFLDLHLIRIYIRFHFAPVYILFWFTSYLSFFPVYI